MSLIDTYRNNIKRKKEEEIRLNNEKTKYLSDKANRSSKIVSAKQSISRTKSDSTIKSKIREIDRNEKEVQVIEKKIAEVDKKIVRKRKEIVDEEKKLQREEINVNRRNELEQKKNAERLNSKIQDIGSKQDFLQKEVNKLKESKKKIVILFLASNPKCKYRDENGDLKEKQKLDLDKEAREIKEAITKSLNRDSIDFQTRWATRVQDLFQAINETKPTIIHFSGHGTPNGELVFQDNSDNPKKVSNEAIAEMIAASSNEIRMIVFNNCFSSVQAEMIVDKVEATIGMNTTIGDDSAIKFASQLYSAIGFGQPLDKAYAQAKAMLMLENTQEQNTPELFVKEGFEAKDIIFVK